MQTASNVPNNPENPRIVKNNRISKQIPFKNLKAKTRSYISAFSKSLDGSFIQFNIPDNIRKKLKNAMYVITGLMFGLIRLTGSMHPFGLSFFSATEGELALYAFLGAALSCVFNINSMMIHFTTLTLMYILRRAFTAGRFNEPRIIRMCESAACSLFIRIAQMTSQSFSGQALLDTLVFVCTCSACTYLFSGVVGAQRKQVSSSSYMLCVLSVLFCTVLALEIIPLSFISLCLVAAVVFTLIFAKTNGALYGCVCGFICGFASSDAALSVSLGTAGLISGSFFSSGLFFSPFLFVITAVLSSVYISGPDVLGKNLPEIIIGALIFVFVSGRISEFFRVVPTKKPAQKLSRPLEKSEFHSVSDSLSSLAGTFLKLSEHFRHPSAAETFDIIDDAFSSVCSTCSMNSLCYAKKQTDMSDIKQKVLAVLHENRLSREYLSKLLLEKCIHSEKLCECINKEYTSLAYSHFRANRTGTLASHYSAISRLIRSTEKQQEENRIHDVHLEKLIAKALRQGGIPFTDVFVFGKRTKDIEVHGIQADRIPCSASELATYLSKECKMKISEPDFDISDVSDMVMHLSRKPVINIEYAKTSHAKSDANVNGDTVSFFDVPDTHFFYALISDGMGSGSDAAVTSRLSSIFLEKLLTAGTAKNVSLEMLNSLLLSKNDETFSTVDLLEIDLLNSSACFVKAGAAPSFVLRASKLYKIASSTPPAGIIDSFSAESTKIPLEKGDVIISVSDGVIQSPDDALWLSELIHIDTKDDPAMLAAQILERAKVLNAREDDMSVSVVRIK